MYEIQARATTHYTLRGQYVKPSWIIVHDPGGDPKATEANNVRYLEKNDRGVSAHELHAWDDKDHPPQVYTLADANKQVTHHAGILTRIPGTRIENAEVNRLTVGIEILTRGERMAYVEDGRDVLSVLAYASAERVADLIIALKLPNAGNVLAHREISVTGRRTDPRGIDMEVYRRAVRDWLIRKSYQPPS